MTKNNWLILISAGCIIIAVYEALLNRSMLISITLLAIPLSCCLIFWPDTDDNDWTLGGLTDSLSDITLNDIRYYADRANSYSYDTLKVAGIKLKGQAEGFYNLKQVLDSISIREFNSCPMKVTRMTCEKTIKTFVSNARLIVNRLDVCQAEGSVTNMDIQFLEHYLNENDQLKSELGEYLKALGAISNDEHFTPKYHTKGLKEIDSRRGYPY